MAHKDKNIKSYFGKTFFIILCVVIFLAPISMATAQTIKCFIPNNSKCLIPCNGAKSASSPSDKECTFDDFVQLGQNLINFLIVLSIPLTAIAFAWAGFLMVTSAGSEEKIKQGKAIFGKVLIGFLFILGAWLIVYTITTALLADPTNYTLLK